MKRNIANSRKGKYKALPRSVHEARALVQQDKLKEVWDGNINFRQFIKNRTDSLAAGIKSNAMGVVNALIDSIQWSKLDPKVRQEILRRLREFRDEGLAGIPPNIRTTDDDMNRGRGGRPRRTKPSDPKRKDKPRPAKKKRRRRRKQPWIPGKKIRPRPRPGDRDEPPEEVPPRKPPQPEPWPLLPDPEPTQAPEWHSGVGYFVSIADLKYHTVEPPIYDNDHIVIDFDEQPNGFLQLGPEQQWESEWFEGQIIRGLSVDAYGTYRLNYASNGGFER